MAAHLKKVKKKLITVQSRKRLYSSFKNRQKACLEKELLDQQKWDWDINLDETMENSVNKNTEDI